MLLSSTCPNLLLLLHLCCFGGAFVTQHGALKGKGNIVTSNGERPLSSSTRDFRHVTRMQTLSFLDGLFNRQEADTNEEKSSQQSINSATKFIEFLNEGDAASAIKLFSENCTVDFADFSEPCIGLEALERRLRLMANSKTTADRDMIAIDRVIADDRRNTVGVKFRMKSGARGSAFFAMTDSGDEIEDILWINESSSKPGAKSLNLLRQASKIIEITGAPDRVVSNSMVVPAGTTSNANIAPLKYFEAWNRRDMDDAIRQFASDATYDDTAFPEPFVGQDALRKHLLLCAECFPPSFSFEVEDFVESDGAVCIKWHVENNGEELPFTQGCSFYEISREGLISDGIDFLVPSVVQPGGARLLTDTVRTQITEEPVRLVPLAVWIAYIWIVFFSDGILPGANALQLEQRTWEEVLQLSLNFFLVSPILNLPLSPTIHPMLEGVFNLLLSWAAMFAGFLSDDRKDKPNLFPMLPAVVGMQFLTSAFLLPYLAIRSRETRSNVAMPDLSTVARACESPLLGIVMGAVGSLSIAWGYLGRQQEYGSLFSERYNSFVELLSIDRVGSSFLVDLVIFGLFQFWLVEDDLRRRGIENTNTPLAVTAKYVPFFGLASYLMFRPALPDESKRLTNDCIHK
mmetsp:Transcript_24177/g.67024  ORF Transcript_24177/g.67024 Transcript_24177/m.67024 type:complete len:631 (+) Transcript_24177:196-2088(+)